MISQLTVHQCNQQLPQANQLPGFGNLALDRLGAPGASSLFPSVTSPLQQSLQNGQILMQMMSLLLNLLANGAAGGATAATGGGGGTSAVDSAGGTGSTGGTSSSSGGGGGSTASTSTAGGTVDPSTVKDKSGTSGLEASSKRGLEEAHKYGLPLVSGKRSGGGTSDHDHGNAIDVGTLPIGAASSNGGTAQMKAFAEHMRQEGKAGRLNVKYIIRDGQIASSRDNWEWRPYTYPGKSQGELDALKRSNPGEYNRLQHFDHVHVSFN